MSFFNPFHKVFESWVHPHARTLRSGFFTKCDDALNVIAGNNGIIPELDELHGAPASERFLGLYDYATLFIPYLIETAIAKTYSTLYQPLIPKEKDLDYPIWRYFLELTFLTTLMALPVMVAFCLAITRGLFSMMSMIVSLPLIIVVHLISTLIAAPIKATAALLELNGGNLGQSFENLALTLSTNRIIATLHGRGRAYSYALTDLNREAFKALYQLNAGGIAASSQYYEERLFSRDKYQEAKARSVCLRHQAPFRARPVDEALVKSYLSEEGLELRGLDLSSIHNLGLLRTCLEALPANIVYLDLSWNQLGVENHSLEAIEELLALIPYTVTGLCLGFNQFKCFDEEQLKRIVRAVPVTVVDLDFEECEKAELLLKGQERVEPFLQEVSTAKELRDLVAGYVGRDFGFFAVPEENPSNVARAQALGF